MPALHRIAERRRRACSSTPPATTPSSCTGEPISASVDLDPALLLPAVPHSMFDDPVRPSVLPQLARGWRGRPAVRGSRAGRDFSPRFALVSADGDGASIVLRLTDADAGLDAETSLTLTPSGLLLIEQAVTNRGDGDYVLERLDAVLPVPARAVESLDTTGRWAREKHPQRRGIQQGTWVRSGRHGRTGHDAPVVMAAGTAGFGWRTGEVWALHLGWSGDHESFVERLGERRHRARRRRAAAARRGRARPRRDLPRAHRLRRLVGRRPRRRERPLPRVDARPADASGHPAARGAEHVGGRLLRPRPRHPARSSPTRPRASAWSGSCSTTAGSRAAGTTAPASATGSSTRRCGPAASRRSSST